MPNLNNSIDESRTRFGQQLRALRQQRNLSLRGLQAQSDVNYALISAYELGERAVGAQVATQLADGLGLNGTERQQFLFAAASTRRRDRLVGYARTLAPELINFVPRVLAGRGVDFGEVGACEIRSGWAGEPPGLKDSLQLALERSAGIAGTEFLMLNAGDQKYVCSLVIAPVP